MTTGLLRNASAAYRQLDLVLQERWSEMVASESAVLSARTFCTFPREFSPPEGCGDRAKNVLGLKTRL